MTFDEWFHKEYEPVDLQIKQYAERKEGLHIPATVYLEDLKKAFEAGQKDKEAQIEKMKNCKNCANYMISGKCPCLFRTGWCKNWELAK